MNWSHLPNIISIVRILLVPPVVMILLSGYYSGALLVYLIAGISDGLDGYLAKKYGWGSRLGSILDPLADKALLVASYITLGWLGLLPAWLVAAVLARDVIIVTGAVSYHVLIGRYEMQPSYYSKFNTVMQIVLPLAVLLDAGVLGLPDVLIEALVDIVLVTTLLSGIDYVWTWGRKAWRHAKGRDR